MLIEIYTVKCLFVTNLSLVFLFMDLARPNVMISSAKFNGEY